VGSSVDVGKGRVGISVGDSFNGVCVVSNESTVSPAISACGGTPFSPGGAAGRSALLWQPPISRQPISIMSGYCCDPNNLTSRPFYKRLAKSHPLLCKHSGYSKMRIQDAVDVFRDLRGEHFQCSRSLQIFIQLLRSRDACYHTGDILAPQHPSNR